MNIFKKKIMNETIIYVYTFKCIERKNQNNCIKYKEKEHC